MILPCILKLKEVECLEGIIFSRTPKMLTGLVKKSF